MLFQIYAVERVPKIKSNLSIFFSATYEVCAFSAQQFLFNDDDNIVCSILLS